MQASIVRNTSWLRSAATGGVSLLAVLALAVTLVGVTGCPTPPPPPAGCEADADCDDGRFCNGAETCNVDSNGAGTCVDGEAPCPAEFCVENADFCPECTEDADCDDGLFCNGVETCDTEAGSAGLTCIDGEAPCGEGEECSEELECFTTDDASLGEANPDVDFGGLIAGESVTLVAPGTSGKLAVIAQTQPCTCAWSVDGAGSFDPADACTTTYTPGAGDTTVTVTETCADGVFVFNVGVTVSEIECTSNGDCDDGAFCNGDESCDSNGFCVDGTAPCDAADCDEENDTCQAQCSSNGDCDDGLFCNGDETCGTNGFCEDGASPCAEGETCAEGDAGEICTPTIGVTVDFTLGQDNLQGSGDGDIFSAPLLFNAGTGEQVPTFQNGDAAQGLAGADQLNATYNNLTGNNQTLAPTLGGIETLNLSDFGDGNDDTTISGVNITGVTQINSVGSLTDVFVEDFNALANLGVSNSAFDLEVSFISPAGNGTSDALTLTLTNARDNGPGNDACGITIDTPANGLETLNVVSAGSANKLEFLDGGAATLLTLNISGSAPLTIRRDEPLQGSFTTIGAGSASGGTDLTVGGAANVAYTGGAGNDIVNFAGTYTTSDTINGGGGTNTLGLNAAQAAVGVSQTNVSNIGTLMIVNTLLGETVDVTRFGATDALLDSTGNGNLLLNLPSNMTLGSGNRTITFNNDDLNDQFNVTVSGVGTSDTLTMNFFNADQSFGATQIDTIGAETLSVVSGNGLDGTAADGNVNQVLNLDMAPTTGGGTLNITGGVAFTVLQGITAATVNAAGAGAAFTMETTSCTLNVASGSVTGSPFNDELTGGAGNDSINGGEGNDSIKGNGGADVITTGGGTDHVFFDATGHFGDTIGDFTGGSDNVGLASGIVNFAGVAGTEAAPVELAAANFETGRSAVSQIAAGDALKIVRVSTEQTTADITSQTGAAVAAYVLIFDSTLQRGVLYHDADWSSAAARTLVARFENITTNAGVQALTFTDFEEID